MHWYRNKLKNLESPAHGVRVAPPWQPGAADLEAYMGVSCLSYPCPAPTLVHDNDQTLLNRVEIPARPTRKLQNILNEVR